MGFADGAPSPRPAAVRGLLLLRLGSLRRCIWLGMQTVAEEQAWL